MTAMGSAALTLAASLPFLPASSRPNAFLPTSSVSRVPPLAPVYQGRDDGCPRLGPASEKRSDPASRSSCWRWRSVCSGSLCCGLLDEDDGRGAGGSGAKSWICPPASVSGREASSLMDFPALRLLVALSVPLPPPRSSLASLISLSVSSSPSLLRIRRFSALISRPALSPPFPPCSPLCILPAFPSS